MTVYIVQEVRGRDISSASSFGNLEILLTSDQVMKNYPVKEMDIFHNKLKTMTKEQVAEHLSVLESADDIYCNLLSPAAKQQFSKWLNLIAQKHHIRLLNL